MTVHHLPSTPAPAEAAIRIVGRRSEVRSLIGGNVQRSEGKGAHYALKVRLPTMTYAQGEDWLALRTSRGTVLYNLPSLGFDLGSPGAPRVDGGLQLGTTLKMRGLTPGYHIRKGQFFNIITAGRHWLYAAEEPATADAQGRLSVVMEVMIRHFHNDGDVVEIAQPKIEGFPEIDDDAFMVDAARTISLAFEIEERG